MEQAERARNVGLVAATLPQRASRLVRLLLRHVGGDMTPTMGGVLATLSDGPRRVTDLAELEGLAQPSMTMLVGRLEERGWVERRQDRSDRRVVHVALTAAGREALERQRAAVRGVLAERLARLSEEQIVALLRASEALGALGEVLQQGTRDKNEES